MRARVHARKNSHIHFHACILLCTSPALSCQHCRTVYCYCGNQTAGLQCLARIGTALCLPLHHYCHAHTCTGPCKLAQDKTQQCLCFHTTEEIMINEKKKRERDVLPSYFNKTALQFKYLSILRH